VHLSVNFPARGGYLPLATNLMGGVLRQAATEISRTGPALLAGERLWSGSYVTG